MVIDIEKMEKANEIAKSRWSRGFAAKPFLFRTSKRWLLGIDCRLLAISPS